MKRLILGRHSYTEYPSFSSQDIKRKLTKHGIQIAQNQATKLLNIDNDIKLLISSPAIRAKQTSEIYHKMLKIKTKLAFESFLYHDYTTADFLDLMAKQDNTLDSILIVAHNPTISEICHRLSPDFTEGMQPSTMAILDFDVTHWKHIEVYQGKLKQIIRP